MSATGDTEDLPLAGVRVLELGSFIAGPYCATHLADLGADVVKVENPQGGDQLRETGPFLGGESSIFVQANRNKRSVAVDLTRAEGLDVVRRLASRSDVVVASWRPGVAERFGLDHATLRGADPSLIYVSVSGWGIDGPYASLPGLDIMAQGMSGLMSITGAPGGAPVKVGVPVCDLVCALFAALGTVAALAARQRTGRGRLVEANLFESGASLTLWEMARYGATGTVPGPLGSAHQSAAPYQALRVRDGYITVGASTQRLWERLCAAFGTERLLADPRFADNSARHAHREALAAELEAVTVAQDGHVWLERLRQAGVPGGRIQTYDDVTRDEHLAVRDFFLDAEHPTAGAVRHVASGLRLDRRRPPVRRPSPVLGEHTVEVLEESGLSAGEIARLQDAGTIMSTGTAPARR